MEERGCLGAASALRQCLADARAGANLPVALQGLADRTGLASLARFADGIVIAVEWVTVSTSLELVHRRRVDRPKMSLTPF